MTAVPSKVSAFPGNAAEHLGTDLGAPLPVALARRRAGRRSASRTASCTGRRAWRSTAAGRPAFTGVVQATALAPTALEAEIRATAAVLSGPDGAQEWLPRGGLIVLEDRRRIVIPPAAVVTPDGREVVLADDANRSRG